MEKSIKKESLFIRLRLFFAMLRPLVFMQLKDKLDMSFLKNKKKTLFKIIYTILIFIGLTAFIFLLFKVVIVLGIFSFVQILNFRVYLLLMSIIFAFSFLSCLANVTKTLYFAKDNQVLLTMPVGNGTIFTSKLIVCYLYELIKNATYILPFFFAYGMVMGISPIYYIINLTFCLYPLPNKKAPVMWAFSVSWLICFYLSFTLFWHFFTLLFHARIL